MHPHDIEWIEEQLKMLPDSMRESVRIKYKTAYDEIRKANEGLIAEENLARRECNLRLMDVVEKYGSAYHGKVIAPPKVKV